MKKYLALLFGVIFLLGFSATAFAVHETESAMPEGAVVTSGPAKITLGGEIMVRGWFFDNVTGVSGHGESPAKTETHSFYTTDVSLAVRAQLSDNLMGMVEFETAGNGNRRSGEFIWGDDAAGYDSKANADILIRNAWIQYMGSGLLGTPAGIKIGHMPISLGEKIFLNNERFGDDAILAWVDPTKELHLAAGTVKLQEGSALEHWDDVDGYLVMGTYQWDKDNKLGVNWVWSHSDGNCPSSEVVTPDGVAHPNVNDLNFHNIGVHAEGNISGLSYGAEADFQFGKITNFDLSHTNVKPRGWAVLAKLGYMLDPVNIRVSYARGSGETDVDDDECREFQTLQGPDYEATSRLVHYTQIYERTVRTASHDARLTTNPERNTTNTSIANTTYYNIGFDVTPLPDLSLSVDGFYLRAVSTQAWEADPDILAHVRKTLGWEFDTKGSYKIAKNLTYFVEAGWFLAGDFYKDTGGSEKTVQQFMHGLALSF